MAILPEVFGWRNRWKMLLFECLCVRCWLTSSMNTAGDFGWSNRLILDSGVCILKLLLNGMSKIYGMQNGGWDLSPCSSYPADLNLSFRTHSVNTDFPGITMMAMTEIYTCAYRFPTVWPSFPIFPTIQLWTTSNEMNNLLSLWCT